MVLCYYGSLLLRLLLWFPVTMVPCYYGPCDYGSLLLWFPVTMVPCYISTFLSPAVHDRDLEKDVSSETSGYFRKVLLAVLAVSVCV